MAAIRLAKMPENKGKLIVVREETKKQLFLSLFFYDQCHGLTGLLECVLCL